MRELEWIYFFQLEVCGIESSIDVGIDGLNGDDAIDCLFLYAFLVVEWIKL